MGYASVHTLQPHHDDHHRDQPHNRQHGHTAGTAESATHELSGASPAVSSAQRAPATSPAAPHTGAMLVEVQADVSPGLVGTTIIGRPNQTIRETADRVRMGILNSALDWPSTRRITILLSPADLPKSGAYYDLPMALAVLAAAGQIEPAALQDTVFAGELSLDGALRPTRGIEAITRAAASTGFGRVVIPEADATELPEVPGIEVIAGPSLAEVVAMLREEPTVDQPPIGTIHGA